MRTHYMQSISVGIRHTTVKKKYKHPHGVYILVSVVALYKSWVIRNSIFNKQLKEGFFNLKKRV